MGTREAADFEGLARAYAAAIEAPSFGARLRQDPELRKHLARIYTAIADARRLHEAGAFASDEAAGRLRELLEIDPGAVRDLDVALEVNERWDQLLIEVGDADYLLPLLLAERRRVASTTVVTWQGLFGDRGLPAENAFAAGSETDGAELEDVRRHLSALSRARLMDYRLFRSRQSMKSRTLWYLAPTLGAVVGLLALAIGAVETDVGWEEILLAGAAGAVGATVSGAYKLRDQVQGINAVRQFRATLVVQPLLGAAAGLFLLLALASELVSLGGPELGWAKIGAVGFAAGFSEPFLLGVVERIGKLDEKDDEEKCESK